jgi:diaminobutyrate-2-oxoglutarate transaminase
MGIAMSLDIETVSKENFLETFRSHILEPRNLSYKLQFTGPTGTNAVEAAIKLARKVTGRTNVVAFTNAFHGCSLGALALTANKHHSGSSEALLTRVHRVPYDGYLGAEVDTSELLEKLLSDPSSGLDAPAAIILETIQGEGGLNVASVGWVRNVARIAKKFGALLIADDIQAGCGRSGDFFSFEPCGIEPDTVCMAKSLSGFGLPMSLWMIKPEHDIWSPGKHNGTFRGNILAFVTATTAIREFWANGSFQNTIRENSNHIESALSDLVAKSPECLSIAGRGMMLGLRFADPTMSQSVQKDCFARGLIFELCGPDDNVLKLLPPLNIGSEELELGLGIVTAAVAGATATTGHRKFEKVLD